MSAINRDGRVMGIGATMGSNRVGRRSLAEQGPLTAWTMRRSRDSGVGEGGGGVMWGGGGVMGVNL